MSDTRKHLFEQSLYFLVSVFFCFCVHAAYLLLILVSTNIVLWLWVESVELHGMSGYVPVAINSLALLFAMFLSGFRLGRVILLVLPSIAVPGGAILTVCIATLFLLFNNVNDLDLLLFALAFFMAVLCSLVGCLLSLKIRRSQRKPPKVLPDTEEYR